MVVSRGWEDGEGGGIQGEGGEEESKVKEEEK